jgi:WhiB family redox-sensing transcriptional regulator
VHELMAASQIEISGGDDDVEITAEESLDLTLVETRSAELALIEINTDGLPPELAWQERALCAQTDPEAFFPEKGGSTREAKRVCMSCEVRAECLDYALAKDERFGIWGGLSERERRRVKKQAV